MAAPTLNLTFQQMQVRVAEYLGLADYSSGAAAVPTDAHDLDLCKRMVNDGYRRFMGERRWNFPTPVVSITFDPTGLGAQCVDDDPSRYYMPSGTQGESLSFWTYGQDGPVQSIGTCNEDRIRDLQASATVTGNPTLAAVYPIPDASANSDKVRWAVVFWPTPNAVYTVSCRMKIFPSAMSANSDVTITGYQHDETVLAAALAAAEFHRTNTIDVMESGYKMRLAASIAMDNDTKPRRLGYNGDTSDGAVDMRQRGFRGVTSYNSTDITDLA